MCEEYDLESGLLLGNTNHVILGENTLLLIIPVRKWHQQSDLGRSDHWEYEVGHSTAPRAPTDLLSESLSNVC